MRFKWQMKFPKKGYKLYVYLSGTPNKPAKVYPSEQSENPISSVPQVTTDNNGNAIFWIDTKDYDFDQLFDIKVHDADGRHVCLLKNQNVFDIKRIISNDYIDVTLLGANGEDDESDDTQAIQSAIDYASSISGSNQHVKVLVPKGRYNITSQIIVRPNVLLHTDGIIVNMLEDKFMPAIVFQPHSATSKLRLWGNLGSGVVFGEENEYCDILIGNVRLWNIGEEYDEEKGPKVAVRFAGYNFKFNSLDIDGGNIGIDINLASDIRGDKILSFTASLGMRITSASEHININSITIDTPDWRGMHIDSSHDIFLGNVLAFLNDELNPNPLDYAVVIGEWSELDKVTNLMMNLRVQNTGGTALKISNVVDSIINLNATNSHLATGNSHPIVTAVEYVSGLLNTSINILASDDITPKAGTPSGIFTRQSDEVMEVSTKIKTLSNAITISEKYTPSGTNDSTGEVGDITWDNNYIYIKTSNGWKRISLSSF